MVDVVVVDVVVVDVVVVDVVVVTDVVVRGKWPVPLIDFLSETSESQFRIALHRPPDHLFVPPTPLLLSLAVTLIPFKLFRRIGNVN